MESTESRPSPVVRLFLTSFLILFFELVCIRWVPAHVRFLSFFTNFMLLASFLGVGVGVLAAKRWDPPLRAFAVLVLVLVGLVAWNRFELRFFSADILFFGASETKGSGDFYWSLPLLFTSVTLTFVPLGAWLGRLLVSLPPLQAYAIDIAGAMAGVATYTLVAYLSLGPGVWFGIIAVVLFFLEPRRESALPVSVLVVVALFAAQMGAGSLWSPYYRIWHYPNDQGGHEIDINGIGHQSTAKSSLKESFYFRVHDLFGKKPFRKVLVIGAGTGSDVAIALENGAELVDAVEIDPMIAKLGGELNPQKPYSDPRTKVHVGDGRAFLRTSHESYDLIIFALTDSTALTSAYASLRLESFLYTTESLATAKKRLAPGGMMVLYNYYRHDWIVQRLAGMLQATFGQPPFVTTYGHSGKAAVLLAGPRLAELDAALDRPYREGPGMSAEGRGTPLRIVGMGKMAGDPTIPPAKDDWPFLYLRTPTIPLFYLGSLALIALIALVFVGVAMPRGDGRRFDAHFFFLGAAFMLLETRSLVTFALLFGTTWIVNSLVFFAILGSVLIAILVNARVTIRSVKPIYGLLFGALGLNYFLPPEVLLGIQDPMLRYSLASALTFSPIFLANVVFSRSFKDTDAADTAFGSNLLGAMAGGMLEYLDLLTGTQALLIPVILFYVLALSSWRAKAE